MLSGGESEADRRRREDREVFAERVAAAKRGEEPSVEYEPFSGSMLTGPLRMAGPPMMPPPRPEEVN